MPIPKRGPSLLLLGACLLGIGLAVALVLAAILVHGNAVRAMFGGAAAVVMLFTWAVWHYYRLPLGHQLQISDEERRRRSSVRRDAS